jgi:eukaryotic-like serine/threonine-protein kinase
MSLAPGTRLGCYEIAALIGAGGMGEVYRATDTNLKRAVAIKVLPEALVADAERLARFQREAEVLASLNHPHIAQIHGLEKSTDRIGLVMELVEGPTLADRIAQSALPVSEAVNIAQQIAQALEAAHEQGVIHRDLKPANVKVREDGTVKVLDFGLAKMVGPAEAGQYAGDGRSARLQPDLTLSPTITTPAMTQVGLILGTAAYMSPEQAKGRAADKRGDVWAFGCVLYEMLSGRRAFDGDDVSDTLASVLKTDPDWTALPADLPQGIRMLIQRCLAKDRRQRIGDLSAASFILTEPGALITPAAPAAASNDGRWRAVLLAVAISVIATALVAAVAASALGLFRSERPVAHFSFTLPERQRLPEGSRQVVAVSPNGEHIAYLAGNRLYTKSTADFESRPLPGLDFVGGTANPVFSPDSEWIAFYAEADRTIRRISRTGGASTIICPAGVPPFGMTWAGDNVIFGQGDRGIIRCAANGGKPEQIATVGDDETAHGGQVLPGGEWMIFSVAKASDRSFKRWDRGRIVAHSLSSNERRTLIEGGADARYVSTGHLLYAVDGVLLAVPLDPRDPKSPTGVRVPVLQGVKRSLSAVTAGAQYSVSDSGTLIYVAGPAQTTEDVSLVLADRAGTVTPLKVESDRYGNARVSPDGARLAVDTDDGKEANVYLYELSGTRGRNRLTFGGRSQFPVWSPDGQRVAFQSDREGDRAIFAQRIDGTGLTRLTTAPKEESHIPESWSRDGHLLFSILKEGSYTLWTLSIADGKTARFGDTVSSEPTGAVFTSDGRWVTYHSLPPGALPSGENSGVFVEPFPATGTRYQPQRIGRDFQPVWSRDATELFYIGTTNVGLVAVPVTMKAGVSFGEPKRIPFEVNAGRLSGRMRPFDVLPDGRFVGIVAGSAGTGAYSDIRIVLNWFEELKRKVPSN